MTLLTYPDPQDDLFADYQIELDFILPARDEDELDESGLMSEGSDPI